MYINSCIHVLMYIASSIHALMYIASCIHVLSSAYLQLLEWRALLLELENRWAQ